MRYVTTGQETLLQIAERLTLNAGYYDAIQRWNAGSEELNQVPVNQPLPAGLQFEIPDDWLQPAVRAHLVSGQTTAPEVVVTASRLPNWPLIGMVAVFLFLAFATRSDPEED